MIACFDGPFVLALGIPLLAQQVQLPPAVPYIRVHGEATVSAQPDRMQMDVGVISQGSTSQAAADANAKQSNAVVEQLRKLVPAANIKTDQFLGQSELPLFDGRRASNHFRLYGEQYRPARTG